MAAAPSQSVEVGIIDRLNAETHARAVACGRAGAQCAVKPYELCPSDELYAARIATPFSRVAGAVFDAIKAGRRPNPMSPGAATRWGVGIFVFPAENSDKADAIQRLELRREGHAIQPVTSTVGPISIKATNGTTAVLARGYFAFPVDAFSPTADATVVFVSNSGRETTCTIDRAHLQSLK